MPICRACRWCICRRRRRTSARSPITSTSISTASRRCGPSSAGAASIGMHFSGDWPELELDLWAILEDRPMSDKDKPANPFGRVERTIIRPNPGGRLPQAPAAQSAGCRSGRPPRAPYSPTPAVDKPVLGLFAAGRRLCASRRTSPPPEEWISTPAAPQPPPLARAGRAAAARRRTGRAQRQSDHARRRSAAAAARPPARRADARVVRKPDGAGRRRGQVLRERHPLGRRSPSIRPTPRNTFCARPPTTSCSIFRPTTATSGRSTRC